jgi:hypothetical protein
MEIACDTSSRLHILRKAQTGRNLKYASMVKPCRREIEKNR